MQGTSVLLILSFVAQAGISPLGSALQSSPTAERDIASGSTQFGWQLDANGELEYLIQISPEMLPFMTRENNQKEFQSEIPKELAGRIHRVVVSIGNQVLPRTPSLQEIQRIVPTIASLPPGRIRELEPDAAVVNVNNDGLPDFPFANNQQSGAASGNGLGARSGSPAPTAPLGSSFLDHARSNNAGAQGGMGQASQSSQPSQGQGFQGRFAETAPSLPNGPNVQSPHSNPQSGWGPSGGHTGSGSDSSIPRTGDWQAAPSYPPSLADSWANQPVHSGDNWRNQHGPSSTHPNQGFGPPPERPGLSIADRTRGTDRWPGSLTTNESVGRPGETLIASGNRQSTRQGSGTTLRDDFGGMADSSRDTGMRRSEAENLRPQVSEGSSDGNFHLFVFFVLSVAINLWMVHLLRSLYMRYRTLLTSLRSSAS